MRPTQSWTVCSWSDWPTVAAPAPYRLGPGSCRDVSVEKMPSSQGKDKPDQGGILTLLLTPLYCISLTYLTTIGLGLIKINRKQAHPLGAPVIINKSNKSHRKVEGKWQREGGKTKLHRESHFKRSQNISLPVSLRVRRKDIQGTSTKAQKHKTSIAYSRNSEYFVIVET